MSPSSAAASLALLLSTLIYMMSGGGEEQKTFLYFAYGSNMLTQRIRINNPSARFQSLGRLHHHKLDFNHKSKRWGGAVATIEEEEGNEVWGVLWQLSIDDLPKLDKQEGVPKLYRRKEVEVDIEGSGLTKAVTYQLTVPKLDDRRPSKIYRQVILNGAAEHSLPDHYRKKLEDIEHNGALGDGSIQLKDIF